MGLFVFLTPPGGTRVRRATFDDLHLIEWAGPDANGGRDYDHLTVDRSVTVDFQAPSEGGVIDWRPLGE